MDQASALRSAIIKKNSYNYLAEESGPKVFCIASGKGGVGKSNFTLNLALAMRKRNKRVIIIDADLGLANIEILLGMKSKYGLIDVIKDNVSIEDIIVEGPLGLKIISGGSGISEMVDLSIYKLNKILNSLELLKKYADYILIDTGAGISKSVLSFVSAANEIIVVTNPEPTSIADAYALIKACILECKKECLNVLINNAENEKEAKLSFETLNSVSLRFLKKNLDYLGIVHTDKNVPLSVKKQNPFYLNAPNCRASKDIDIICSELLSIQNTQDNESFAKKIYKFLFDFRG